MLSITPLYYAFGSCSSLEAIYVDSTWELPATCTGMATFYNCTKIVGGNGTTYSSSATGAAMMKVDREGQAGYLTAAD